jgi:CRISPR-associated endonuclease/helicase Cas3
VLITELCPWSSFVQRYGRCRRKRTENTVQIHWLDYQQEWKTRPYDATECEATRDRSVQLPDASLHKLAEIPLPKLDLPSYQLTKRDVKTFFCTHPKNRDTIYTISQYVRDPTAFTVAVV